MDAFGNKQPFEAYYVDFDFTNVLVSPDTISSAVVSAVDDSGTDATSVITTAVKQNIVSPKVYVWVTGGVSGTMYTITCKIITVNLEKYEMDAEIYVKEIS